MTRRHAIAMIGTAALSTLVSVALARLAFGLILPAMQADLGLTYRQAGTLGTATALGYVGLVMVAGAVAARRGGRFCVVLGLSLALIGFTGLSLASHYWVLLGLMVLLGFATAFTFTPMVSVIGAWFPQRRGIALGLLNSGVGIGMFGAGMLVPAVLQSFGDAGWRWIWAGFAAVALLVVLAALAFVTNPPSQAAANEQRPANDPPIHRNRSVVMIGLIYCVIGCTFIVQAIFMYSYAISAGVPPLTAGRFAAMLGILGVFARPLWGALSDRIGRANALTTAMSLSLVATGLPMLWPVTASFAVHYALAGLTTGGLFTTVLAAASERVEPRQAALAVSFITVFFA